jgi:orotate phosphoribosyltransferase-like protein
MKEYYYGIIQANYASQDETNVVSVPDVARNNALAQLWDQIKTNEAKVEAQIVTETEGSPERTEAAKKVLRELHEHYPKKPRKITEAKEKTEKN